MYSSMLIYVLVLMLLCNCYCIVTDERFYIYDWPDVPIDVFPVKNTTLPPKTAAYSDAFNENNGIGADIDRKHGWFQTWQFSVFRNAINRLRLHPMRTR